jgi:hypothetical protein
VIDQCAIDIEKDDHRRKAYHAPVDSDLSLASGASPKSTWMNNAVSPEMIRQGSGCIVANPPKGHSGYDLGSIPILSFTAEAIRCVQAY